MARHLARFGFTSGLSLLAILGLTALLHHGMGWESEMAYGATLVTVFAGNFAALRWWVYRELEQRGRLGTQLGKVAIGSASFRGLEYLGFLGLHTAAGLPWLPAVLSVSIASFVGKFFFYRWALFNRAARS